MAYVKRRKYKSKVGYQAIIRRKGFKTSVKSFSTRTDAKKWARAIERKLDTGNYTDYSEASKLLLGDLFKRYVSENKHKMLSVFGTLLLSINVFIIHEYLTNACL